MNAPHALSLTLLYHPDLSRVGQRAVVPAQPGVLVPLSRVEPAFAPPGRGRDVFSVPGAQPLQDPRVSRRPSLLALEEGETLTLTPAGPGMLTVDGEPVGATCRLSAAALRAGVILDISKRVVLLVHRIAVARDAPDCGLVGDSDAIEALRRAIVRIADLDIPVLIRGETGVGKERVAQAVHERSPRASGPFVAINVATLGQATAVAELFGHEKGAFTGAHQRQVGLFERAHGGTLFLDEIGELSMDVQAMLLRTLETGEILPLGGREHRRVDVRVLAATDANLEEAIARGRFRAALLHRLQGSLLSVPPLRQRRDDIPRLLLHFLRDELSRVGGLSHLDPPDAQALPWFPRSLMLRLVQHSFPGNVRQLRNAARQIVVSGRDSAVVVVDESLERMLEQGSAPAGGRADRVAPSQPTADAGAASGRGPDRDIDEDTLIQALRASGWSIGATATALGIPRTTLYRLIERSRHIRKAIDISVEELTRCHDDCGGDLDLMSARLEVSKRGLKLRLRELDLSTRDDVGSR